MQPADLAGPWRLAAAASPLVAAVVLQFVAGAQAPYTERWYSRDFYPPVRHLLGAVSGRVPFVLGEALLALAGGAVLYALVQKIRAWRSGRASWRSLVRDTVQEGLFVGGVLSLVFLAVWGLNYQRMPLADNLELMQRSPSPKVSAQLARFVVIRANRARAISLDDPHNEPLVEILNQSWKYLGQDEARCYPGEPAGANPKPFFGSSLMSSMGLSGVYMPFTGEACYNSEIPAFDLPFAMAHEMAHQRGVARESEANFMAFLVCAGSGSARVAYSGFMGAMGLVTALRRTSPSTYESVMKSLDPGVAADLETRRQFWKSREGLLMDLTRNVNHLYLRSQRIPSGVRNYAEGDALIIEYLQGHPELRWGKMPGL